jgi:hypothetical protein
MNLSNSIAIEVIHGSVQKWINIGWAKYPTASCQARPTAGWGWPNFLLLSSPSISLPLVPSHIDAAHIPSGQTS